MRTADIPGRQRSIFLEITKIPRQLSDKLKEKSIDSEKLILAVKSDMNSDSVRCDNWLLVTESEIIIVGGTKIIVPKKHRKLLDQRLLEVRFGQISYDCFPLEELEDFKVEELISTARLTAKNKTTGNTVLLTLMTNTVKPDMFKFVKYINEYIKDKKITPSEGDDEEICCPKCGQRYADPNRKICPRCMDKGKIIKQLAHFFYKYKISIAVIVIMLILSSALSVIAPYVSAGFYYDQVLSPEGKFFGQLLLVLGIIIATRVLSTLVTVISTVTSVNIAAKITYDLKKVIFGAIERLSLSFFTNRQTGGLMEQVNNDATSIYWFFCDGFPYFLINIVQTVAILIIMFITDWSLTLLSVMLVPVMVLLIAKFFAKMEKLHAKRYTRRRAMNATLSDVLSGVRVVKAFSREKNEIKRFEGQSKRLAGSERTLNRFGTVAFPAAGFMLFTGNIVVWAVGGWSVIQGTMTYGTLITFVAYMNLIYSPMFFFVDMVGWAAECLNAMQRLCEIMEAKPDVVEKDDPVHIGEAEGRVTFKNVQFSYENNRKVIDGVSFEAQPGQSIGIVGHTGAGKSTLANLLIRLYDVSDGMIEIDGVNVKDIAFEDLRKNIAIVSQETYLFSGTIADNIGYAKPGVGRDEIIEAAKIAGAHDFIVKLPEGYSTRIGFGHKELSGGERQRVSIARAVLRDPKILILDEATAAMDTETERRIQNALTKLSKGRTTIMIAHRLSTLRDCDYLVVIENGKMPEFGTHQELIKKKGIYFNLYKLQSEALRNIGIEA